MSAAAVRNHITLGRAATVAGSVATSAFALWSRTTGLSQSLWKDETRAVAEVIRHGPGTILFHDLALDDHVLFNLVAWVLSVVPGDDEIGYRLGAVLPSMAGLLVLAIGLRRRLGAVTAAVATILLVASPVHIDLSKQARGYGLAFLAMSLLVVAAIDLAGSPDAREPAAAPTRAALRTFTAAGVIGCLGFVFFAVPFIITALALVAGRTIDFTRRIAARVAVVAVTTAVVYARGIDQLARSAGDFRDHRSLPRATPSLIVAGPRIFFLPTFDAASNSVGIVPSEFTRVALYGLLVPSMVLGCFAVARVQQRPRAACVLALGVVGTPAVMVLARLAIAERYWAWSMIPMSVLAGVGVQQAFGFVGGLGPRRLRGMIAALTAVITVAVIGAVTLGTTRATRHNAHVPLEDFKHAGALMDDFESRYGPVGLLVATDNAAGLDYYVRAPDVLIGRRRFDGERELDTVPRRHAGKLACDPATSVAFVLFNDDDEQVDLDCVASRGGTVIEFAQHDRGGRMIVALVAAGGPARARAAVVSPRFRG